MDEKSKKIMHTIGNQCQIGLGTNYVYKIYKNPVKKMTKLKNTTTNTNTIHTITQNNGNN